MRILRVPQTKCALIIEMHGVTRDLEESTGAYYRVLWVLTLTSVTLYFLTPVSFSLGLLSNIHMSLHEKVHYCATCVVILMVFHIAIRRLSLSIVWIIHGFHCLLALRSRLLIQYAVVAIK